MQPKIHLALEQSIREGVTIGYRRAFKHVENPTEEQIVVSIETAVLNSIYEWFDV